VIKAEAQAFVQRRLRRIQRDSSSCRRVQATTLLGPRPNDLEFWKKVILKMSPCNRPVGNHILTERRHLEQLSSSVKERDHHDFTRFRGGVSVELPTATSEATCLVQGVAWWRKDGGGAYLAA